MSDDGGGGGGQQQGPQDAFIMMDQILDMLKLLDYENKFCKNKGFKPLSKVYFATQDANPSQQFINFISLVSWLLSVNNHQVQGWNKYDDPMTASQNIIIELQKLGIELGIQPGKLKSGFGESVCTVLLQLTNISIQNKFKWKKHKISDDGAGNLDGGDDMDDDDRYEGDADVADMLPGGKVQDDGGDQSDAIDDELDFNMKGGGGHGEDVDVERQQIIQSNIGREEWMLEVERVGHRLKINKAGSDGKEWRSHMDQTKKFHDAVKQSLPEVRGKLERLSDDVSKALEKIAKKEAVLTRSFQGMTGDYRAHSDNLKSIQDNFQAMSKNVTDLETELMEVNERLNKTQGKIDDTGKSFSDNSPLQNIKKSIGNVKNDIKSIDIRIGVVSNTLLQLKLKERSKQIEDGKPMDILDNEYEGLDL